MTLLLALVFSAFSAVSTAEAGAPVDTDALRQQTGKLTLAGRWDEALALIAAPIDQAAAAGDVKTRGVLTVERGRILMDSNFYRKNDPGPARRALAEGLAYSRGAGAQISMADAAQYMAQLDYADSFETKKWDRVRLSLQRVLEVREKIGDKRGISETQFYIGLTYEQEGKPDPAIESYKKSLAISEELGDLVLQSYARRHIGGIQEERGELGEAEKNIESEIDLRRRGGFLVGIPFALRQKADFVAAHGAGKAAAMKILEEAIAEAGKCNSVRGLYLSRVDLSRLALETGNAPRAVQLAEQAVATAQAFGAPSAVAEAEKQLAAAKAAPAKARTKKTTK